MVIIGKLFTNWFCTLFRAKKWNRNGEKLSRHTMRSARRFKRCVVRTVRHDKLQSKRRRIFPHQRSITVSSRRLLLRGAFCRSWKRKLKNALQPLKCSHPLSLGPTRSTSDDQTACHLPFGVRHVWSSVLVMLHRHNFYVIFLPRMNTVVLFLLVV